MTTQQSGSITTTMNSAQWGMLFFLALIWGGSYFFNEVALRELPTLTIVGVRSSLGGLLLLPVILSQGLRLPRKMSLWWPLIVMGLLNNALPFALIVYGQTHIEGGLASILNATTPLFAVVLAHFLTTDERLTANKLAGVLMGLAGVVILLGPSLLAGLSHDLIGGAATLTAGCCYAVAGIYGRRLAGQSPLVCATGMLLAGGALLLPFALIVDQPWNLPAPGWDTLGSLFGLAGLSSSLAYVLYFRILATAGAVNMMLVTLLIPGSAVMLGVVFLGERPGPEQFIGMAVICASLLVTDGRLVRRLRPGTGRMGG